MVYQAAVTVDPIERCRASAIDRAIPNRVQ